MLSKLSFCTIAPHYKKMTTKLLYDKGSSKDDGLVPTEISG